MNDAAYIVALAVFVVLTAFTFVARNRLPYGSDRYAVFVASTSFLTFLVFALVFRQPGLIATGLIVSAIATTSAIVGAKMAGKR